MLQTVTSGLACLKHEALLGLKSGTVVFPDTMHLRRLIEPEA